MTTDIGGLELGHIFAAQTRAFKINISYGSILRNRTSDRYRYYHSSCNCCGRYLDEPSLITHAETFNRMKTMHDFLVWYNNRYVVPFLDAIDKQFVFYKQQNIDMFKDGVSVPGLTLLYLFNELPSNTFFNQTNIDLHLLVKDNIVGGPAIIFHRYHEKDVTKIRGEETCRSIVGYDANSLYMWALMQDMPTGWYVRRRE